MSLLLCLLFKKSNKLFTLKLFYNLSHNLLKLESDMLFGDEFDSNLLIFFKEKILNININHVEVIALSRHRNSKR